MPPAVPLVAAVAGYAASAAIGGGLLGALAGFVVSTAISQIGGRAFAKQPKQEAFSTEASGRTQVVRSSVESHKVVYGTAKVSGPLVFVKTVDSGVNSNHVTDTGTNLFLHMVIALAGHEVEEIGTVYANDLALTLDPAGFAADGPYTRFGPGQEGLSYLRVTKHLGSPDQEADPDLVGECGLNSSHRLRGIAYLYVRLQYHPDVFPLGIPNFSAVVKGKKVYDPRTDTTAWSNNPALCVRDYLTADSGFGCAADEVDDTYVIAAANVCDEAVPLAAGGDQPRYTCDGVVDTAAAPLENLNALLTGLAGVTTYVQGAFRLYAGAYDAPAGDIDEDTLAGPITVRARTPRKELFNAVKGTYVDPLKSWQPTDFPFVTNPAYEAQDGGGRIYKDVELPYTTHPEAAQRIGKILLEKARQGIVVETTLKHHALRFAAYDVVTVTNAQLGWSAKPFRVLKWRITDAGPISVVLQEESAASYDWASGEATTVDPAPDTTLPDPFDVDPPGTPSVEEVLYATTDGGGVKSKAVVTWNPSPDSFVAEYQVEFKLTADAGYTFAGRTLREITTLEVPDIAPGVYDFRVKAISSLGVSSPYATTVKEIFGLTAPPADVTNFSLNAISNNAHVTWDQVPDLDVRVGGSVRIRYTPETGTPTWAGAIDVGPALPGIATSAVLPLLDGTYLIKAVDSAGNESVTPATIRSTIANIVKMNQVATASEAPAFAGAKTDMEVVDGTLRLAGSTVFDDAPGDFDDAPGLFDLGGGGGYVLAGSYQFAGHLDVGKVTTSRVTAAIEAGVFADTIDFDSADGAFDDRSGLFDGGDESNVTTRLEVRTTDDDPAGSPAWGGWRQFFVGDYTCRAYQFRILVTSRDATNNIQVVALGVTVDVPDITDGGTLTTSAAGLTPVAFAKTFVIAPTIPGVTIQNAQTGDFEVITAITATGFQLGVKNAAGSFVVRTVGWGAVGY